MPAQLDAELRRLLAHTNDQRRRFGQAIYHFYRTLGFWMRKGRPFFDITRLWSASGAAIFASVATSLGEFGEPRRDPRLRRFVGEVLTALADDLERGDHMLVPHLRWLETRFPELTAMMREEREETRLYDVALARTLADALTVVAGNDRADVVRTLRAAAGEVGAE